MAVASEIFHSTPSQPSVQLYARIMDLLMIRALIWTFPFVTRSVDIAMVTLSQMWLCGFIAAS